MKGDNVMYFERVKQEEGLNMIKENPCRLLDFGKLILSKRNTYEGNSEGREILLVMLSGICSVDVGGETFKDVGGRPSVFVGKSYSVYIPPHTTFAVSTDGEGSIEAALAFAKAEEEKEPFVIIPEEVVSGKWGISNFSRTFHQILVNGVQKDKSVNRLIVGETFTPSGNWSTYPPHRHEHDNFPEEVFMEEMYYFKVQPENGWGLTKFYTKEKDIDYVFTVENETILKMPKGYHTVVSAPGYTTYYLWLLAGNTRVQAPYNDPDLAWVARTIPMIKNIEENLR
jgi:5-deoxy-glucuronate isomerase